MLANAAREYELGENNELRSLGQAVACETYNGTYAVPNEDSTAAEIINDEPAGYITTFQVWQERYRVGPGEMRQVINNEIFELAPSVLGSVDICTVYTGQTFIPGSDGQPEEITDDDQVSVIPRVSGDERCQRRAHG